MNNSYPPSTTPPPNPVAPPAPDIVGGTHRRLRIPPFYQAIIYFVIVPLLFGAMCAACFGAPIKINTGTDLTARVWPDGTELQLPKDAVLLVDKPVKWRGFLTVNLNGGALRNRMTGYAGTFEPRDGQRLLLFNGTLIQGTSVNAKLKTVANRGITQWGGDVELRNILTGGGQGVQIESSRSFTWIGGGTDLKNPPYSYTIYAGNNLAGKDGTFADRVYVEGCNFANGARETGVRIMGASAQFIRSTFDANNKGGKATRKESVQARHGDIYFGQCNLISGQAGTLAPSIDGGKHTAYALKHPTIVKIEGGSMLGYWEVAGNTRFTTKDFRVLGGDPRGTGGQQPFNLLNYGKGLRPTGISIDTDVSGFKRFAAPGWQMVSGCTLEGRPVK